MLQGKKVQNVDSAPMLMVLGTLKEKKNTSYLDCSNIKHLI